MRYTRGVPFGGGVITTGLNRCSAFLTKRNIGNKTIGSARYVLYYAATHLIRRIPWLQVDRREPVFSNTSG